MHELRIGIVILSDNNEKTIEHTLQSVISQEYINTNIYIIDNASKDDSWFTICNFFKQDAEDFEFVIKFNDIKVSAIHNEFHTNFVSVMNTGITNLWNDVDVLGFLPGSNIYNPGAFLEIINCLEDRVGLVYFDHQILFNEVPINVYQESFSRDRLSLNIDFGPLVFINRKSLDGIGLINPDKNKEALRDFWLRITERFAALHIPKILTRELSLNAETRT